MLLLLFLAVPASARPQVLVVIADHLTLADVTRPGLPNFARLQAEGQMALMSPGLAHGKDPLANVYATLGAGDSIAIGNVSQGRLATALHQAGIRTALIGGADGDDTGEYRPALLLLPFADETHIGADDGTVSDPIACGGKRIDPARLWAQTQTALTHCDFVLVHDGDFARIEREDQQGDLSPRSYALHRQQALAALDAFLGLALLCCEHSTSPPRRLMLVTPTPPLTGQGTWDSLTPLLQLPPPPWGVAKVKLLARSDTTQTVGLVSTRDVAPTVLNALGIPPPLQMTGAVIADAPLAANIGALARLRRLDRLTRLNQDAQNPLFWSLGFTAAAVVFAGLVLYLTGRMATALGARRISLYGLRLLSAWPLALLLAPLTDPPMLAAYFAAIILLTAALAPLPSPSAIYSLTAVVLLADGLTGTRLVSQSVLSAYALSGIRFYGIGNEYMGLLLGGALLAAALLRGGPHPVWDSPHPPTPSPASGRRGAGKSLSSTLARLRERVARLAGPGEGLFGLSEPGEGRLLLWFALVTFVLSYPAFGAKAGGAITATATFVLAWRGLRRLPLTWKHGVGGIVGGFALVFLWAVVGHWLPSRHTHIDTAVHAVGQGRLGYIAGVAIRKIGLAMHVFLLPGTLMGLLGLALIGSFGSLFLRRQVTDYLKRHPRFAAVWHAGLWGCLIAVLFNDSGVVAAILLVTCLIVTLLHGLYQECALSPSTLGKSASASPSVTS